MSNLIDDPNMNPEKVASIFKTNPPDNLNFNATAIPGSIKIELKKSGSYIALHWEANGVETYDYVALYDHAPNGDPWSYLREQWQWTSNHSSPHVTQTIPDGGEYWIAYCRYSYEKNGYQVQAESNRFVF